MAAGEAQTKGGEVKLHLGYIRFELKLSTHNHVFVIEFLCQSMFSSKYKYRYMQCNGQVQLDSTPPFPIL